MSAWIVSKTHIDAMITAATTICHNEFVWSNGEVLENPDKMGDTLLRQNVRSVNARYRSKNGRSAYRFEPIKGTLDIVTIIKAIDCYEYQSCETDDWKETESFEFCQQLRNALIGKLPGYDHAPWGIDSPAQVQV